MACATAPIPILRPTTPSTRLLELPNEILIDVLDAFQTLALLRLRAVSHRILQLATRILHGRLLEAASLLDRKLLIECYHPSARVTEPILYCDYLGTPGLGGSADGRGLIVDFAAGEGPLSKIYSRFRPTRSEPELTKPPKAPSEVPGTRPVDAAEPSPNSRPSEVVTYNVNLDPHENFSQLQFSARLGQTGPRKGIFLSIVDILEQKTFRLFRQWLTEMARHPDCPEQLIWVDGNKKIAGLKVHVQEKAWSHGSPILLHKDQDHTANFILKLEEIRICTIQLLLAVEQSSFETENGDGNAMIFASFMSPVVQEPDEEALS